MKPTPTPDLLPCPFCGSTNLKTGGDDKVVGVWCLTCQAAGPNHYGSREWNDRALSQPAAAVVGEPVAWRYRDSEDEPWQCEHWDYLSEGAKAEMKMKHKIVVPLYDAPSAPEGMREALEKIAAMRWHEDADLDDICTIADRALGGKP